MELLYRSTRGAKEPVTASKAILQGLAEDGGLFVPDSIPKLTCSMEQLAGMTYQETAYEDDEALSHRLYRGRIEVLY